MLKETSFRKVRPVTPKTLRLISVRARLFFSRLLLATTEAL